MIVTRSVSSRTETSFWCWCAFSFVSEQTTVWFNDDSLLLHRFGTYGNCEGYCKYFPGNFNKWQQCCTGNLCNNLTIPANIFSVADLKNCYKGESAAECTGTSAFTLSLADRIRDCQRIHMFIILVRCVTAGICTKCTINACHWTIPVNDFKFARYTHL